jgi:hypothetical protein
MDLRVKGDPAEYPITLTFEAVKPDTAWMNCRIYNGAINPGIF